MRKWMLVTISLLVILTTLLSGCTPAATPAPTTAPAATQAPAATKAPEATKAPAAQVGTEAKPLVQIFVPSGDTQAILAGAKELDKLIKDKTGLVTASSVSTSYAAAIEAMGAGKADIVWLAPFAYVLAHDKYKAEVLLITERNGTATYKSQIIYNKEKNPNLKSLEELKGKKFAFVDAASASGWLYPGALLKAKGLDPQKDVEAVFAGSHNAAVLAVYKGQVDAGACYDDARTTIAKDFPDVKDKVEILMYTDPIPNDTVSVRVDLPADVKTKLKDGLKAIAKDEKGAEVLKAIYQISGLQDGTDAAFDPVRATAKSMNINLEEAVKPPTPKPATPAPQVNKKIKVGLVTDTGGVNDKSFNQSAWAGVEKAAKDLGLEVTPRYIESKQVTDYEKNIDTFATEGYDMIISVGFLMGDVTAAKAKQYPNIKFAIIDVSYFPTKDSAACPDTVKDCYADGGLKNVTSLMFQEDEVGYLAGVLAACMSKSGVIGSVAGMEIPPVIRFVVGYQNGAKSVNPNIQALNQYIPSFVDPAKGKEVGLAMIDKKADVIFGVGGNTGNGGLLAAKEKGLMGIGVDVDQYLTYPEVKDALITSAAKNVDVAVYEAIKALATGALKAGVFTSNLKNGGIGLAPYHDWDSKISQDCKTKVQKATDGLKAGTLVTGYKP